MYYLPRTVKDTIFKLIARQLADALPDRFHLPFAPILDHFPTEHLVLDIHREQVDTLFLLADDSLLHIEFQSTAIADDLRRFARYDLHIATQYHRLVHTVVFYGAGIRSAATTADWGSLHFAVSAVFLGREDGAATLARLQALLAAGTPPSAADLMDLILLPMMRHRRPMLEVVDAAVDLVRQLPQEQQERAVACLAGMASGFLDEPSLLRLMEELKMNPVLDRWLDERYAQGIKEGHEKGIEQGREEGVAQGREEGVAQALLLLLRQRFQQVPPETEQAVLVTATPERLEALIAAALAAPDLDTFAATLHREL